MLKIRALNRESLSDEDAPAIRKELQEEITLETYNKALRFSAAKEYEEAKSLLITLINDNIPALENQGGLPKSMGTLKYSCYLNIGNIYYSQLNNTHALDNYLEASKLDETDVTLWHKIGKLAIKENRFRQAIFAFTKGLECNESHWPCLDQLISILYAVQDMITCLYYIGKALILDNGYVKGLVLREQIYKDNPALKEYYQLYNSDYIWEPCLDIKVSQQDKKEFLDQAQALINQINETECALKTKPLETISLPKPLTKYSWLSLGETVVELHKYLTANEKSHFTFVSLTESIDFADEEKEKTTAVTCPPDGGALKPSTDVLDEEKDQMAKIVESVDSEHIVGRRQSQTSEENCTPNHTDCDEEHENEDQDKNADQKSNEAKRKSLKRKRNLLLELRVWGWHSKRKQSRKSSKQEKFYTVEDALNQIIPEKLLKCKVGGENMLVQDESMNTMDIYNMFIDNRNCLSPIHSLEQQSREDYFASEQEKTDIINLWRRPREYCDVIVLISDFVMGVSKLWHLMWPKPLIKLYIEAYQMYREHHDFPNPFADDNKHERFRHETLSTLLYGELLMFSNKLPSINDHHFHASYLSFLQTVSAWERTVWNDEYLHIFIRVHWLAAYVSRKDGNNDLAVRALQLIEEVIVQEENKLDDKYLLTIPNCAKCNCISLDVVRKLLNHLSILESLSCLEDLFSKGDYRNVADVVQSTFCSSSIIPTIGRVGRPAQLGMLLHSLWYIDMSECFIWCENVLHEALKFYHRPSKDREKWEKIVEKCLAMMEAIVKVKSDAVIDFIDCEKVSRLTENLAKIICKQMNTDSLSLQIPLNTIAPWILLYHLLVREEIRQNVLDVSDEEKVSIPASMAILFAAHQFLGGKSWCLTQNGELLHLILDILLEKGQFNKYEHIRKSELDVEIQQALFCLYQHPSKKNKLSRHLADHKVDPLPLTWEKSFQLYEFYAPESLPEFNTYKSVSISQELEQLLLRITALTEPRCDPQRSVAAIDAYLRGAAPALPDPIAFPNKIRAIYYLLGDYYFKQREFERCVRFFAMDVAINPRRMDAWACLALSFATQLENKLYHCKRIEGDEEFLDMSRRTRVCFERALALAPDNVTLRIEFATFEYMAHAFCSRYLKYESENLSMEKFEFLENKKNSFLESSGQSFEKAIALYETNENETDERWLHYYILGKIAEKKHLEPSEYLNYYLTACNLLDEMNATYPDKIELNSPKNLSVEALELYYRINASIMKYLELHEEKPLSSSLGQQMKRTLDALPINRQLVDQRAKKKIEKVNHLKNLDENGTEKAKSTDEPEKASKVEETISTLTTNETIETKDQQTTITETDAIANKTNASKVETDKSEEIQKEMEPPSVSNLSNVEKDTDKRPDAVLKVVDEVILVDADYDVIMILSSSDDENDDAKKSTAEVVNEAKSNENAEKKESATEMGKNDHVASASGIDVQQVLDKMMLETMRNTDDVANEIDSDTSVVEKPAVPAAPSEENPQIADDAKKSEKTGAAVEPMTDESRDSTSSSSSETSSSSSSDSDSEDESETSSSSSSSSSEDESGNEVMSKNEINHLIDRCIKGLEQCIIRLPKHYKAIYRLAHFFFNYKSKKDLVKCKQLLLTEYKCSDGTTVQGLFADKKANNFFSGIWRIPSSEIDRPGSFAAHMSRCITFLLQLLSATNESKTLLDIYFHLKRPPDPDNIYIRDSERIQFSEQALSLCIQSLKKQIKLSEEASGSSSIKKLLHDIFKIYMRIQKYVPEKKAQFAQMLVELYKKLFKEKVTEGSNVLDMAIKYCQQSKLLEKQNMQAATQKATPRNPLVPMGPVLPAPSMLSPQSVNLKRPGSSRPRGRPPLNKLPNQVKAVRGKSSSFNSSNVKANPLDQNVQYEYLKKYQEELLKQYNQNLNYMQLAQAYQNQNAIANAFLQQAGLFNPANFLNSLSNLSAVSNLGASSSKMNDVAINQNISTLANIAFSKATAPKEAQTMEDKLPPSTTLQSNIAAIGNSLNSASVDKIAPLSVQTVTKESSHKLSNISPVSSNKSEKVSPKNLKNNSPGVIKKQSSSNMSSDYGQLSIEATITKIPTSNSNQPKDSTPPISLASSLSITPATNKPQINVKKSSIDLTKETVPKLNIGATITKVPTNQAFVNETKKLKHNIDSLLPKIPPSLSMTPIENTAKIIKPVESKSKSDIFQQLPSSITMIPSSSKTKTQDKVLSVEQFPNPSSLSYAKNSKSFPLSSSRQYPLNYAVPESSVIKTVKNPKLVKESFPSESADIYSSQMLMKYPGVITNSNNLRKSSDCPKRSTPDTKISNTAQVNYSSISNIHQPIIDMNQILTSHMRTTSGCIYPKEIHPQNPYNISANTFKKDIINDVPSSKASSKITPITRTSPSISYSQQMPTLSTSPAKTLQEKLADKKKQQASKQLLKTMDNESRKNIICSETMNFANPHAISKILPQTLSSTSSSIMSAETALKNSHYNKNDIPHASGQPRNYSNPFSAKPTPQRKSSSEDDVVFIG